MKDNERNTVSLIKELNNKLFQSVR